MFDPHYLTIGGHFSNTELSDLKMVGTGDIFVYIISHITKSWDSPGWLIQTCYQFASSRVPETAYLSWPCTKCFQKCFSAENLIILSLNTVIPIFVSVSYEMLLGVSTNGLFIAIQ